MSRGARSADNRTLRHILTNLTTSAGFAVTAGAASISPTNPSAGSRESFEAMLSPSPPTMLAVAISDSVTIPTNPSMALTTPAVTTTAKPDQHVYNSTGYLVEQDEIEYSILAAFSDMQTVFLACISTLLPLIAAMAIGFGVRLCLSPLIDSIDAALGNGRCLIMHDSPTIEILSSFRTYTHGGSIETEEIVRANYHGIEASVPGMTPLTRYIIGPIRGAAAFNLPHGSFLYRTGGIYDEQCHARQTFNCNNGSLRESSRRFPGNKGAKFCCIPRDDECYTEHCAPHNRQ